MASRCAGQIVQRGESKWLVRIFLGRDDAGRRSYFNATVSGTKRDAQRLLTEKLRELDTGTFVKPTRRAKQALAAYLNEWIAARKASARTLDDYRGIIRRYFDAHPLGKVRIDQLAPTGIRRFYVDLQEQGLSPRTVQYAHTVLHMALEQAVEDGLIPRNPAKLARKVLETVERSEKQVFTVEQARTFIEHVQEDRYAALWLLLLDAGLRPGEALGENAKVVQERLRHRDVGMTLNTYSHIVAGMQEQATARLAQALGGA